MISKKGGGGKKNDRIGQYIPLQPVQYKIVATNKALSICDLGLCTKYLHELLMTLIFNVFLTNTNRVQAGDCMFVMLTKHETELNCSCSKWALGMVG